MLHGRCRVVAKILGWAEARLEIPFPSRTMRARYGEGSRNNYRRDRFDSRTSRRPQIPGGGIASPGGSGQLTCVRALPSPPLQAALG